MARHRENALPERIVDADLRAALVFAPFVLLFVVLLAVKSAHSSASFQIDNELILANLKRQIAATTAKDSPAVGALAVAATGTEAAPSSALREVREVVRRGDTLGGVLKRVGLNSTEITRWSETAHRHVSLGRLQAGHKFTFLVPSGTDRLAGLQYEVSPESTLVMHDDGPEITAQLERLPRSTEVRVVSGTIESSLYAAASRRGVPDAVISSMVDIFGWEVDFSSDLQEGDTYRVAYEAIRDLDGTVTGGKVLAAELETGGRTLEAVYFEADDDGGNYYTPEGRSFGRSFLKYPLEFTRITSQFASSRFHPLLGIHRPHMGVDFAAPIGTPVRAIASGRVEYAGWKGGSGRFIKLDHGSGLESSYSHLNGIISDVRGGTKVQVGQVIGYVGATGLATGPHLHFALYRDGVYVNPMTVKLPASPPLSQKYMRDFAEVRDQVLQQLASAPLDGAPGELRVASAPSLTNSIR